MTCVGIPFDRVRPLEEDERGRLQARAKGLRLRRIALGVGTAFVPLILFAPLMLSSLGTVAALGMIPALWACIVLPLKWLDARKRAKVALASASATEADVFEGVPNVGAFTEASLRALVTAGLVLDDETPQRIDRIGASGETIALNGVPLDPPVWTDVAEVAPPRSPASEFPPLVPGFAMDEPGLGRRPLSPAEIEELRRLSPGREALRGKGCTIGLAAYTLAGILFQRFNQDEPVGFRFFVYVARVLLLGYLGWQTFRALREGAKLRRDLAEGCVMRVEAEKGMILEVLPHLRLVWTVEGEPAYWRHGAQAKPRPPV